MSRELAHTLQPEPQQDEEDLDLERRVRALEHRVRASERRAAPDFDSAAQDLERLVEVVAGELVETAEARLRSTIAAEAAETRASAEMTAARGLREARELIERTGRVIERELAQSVAEARGELRRAFSPSTPQAYLPHRRYAAGEVVTHGGGTWQQISANGSMEVPGEHAASWLLIADGIREVRAHPAAGDNGDVVLDVVFASGRSMGSKLSGVLPRYRGPFKPGTSYRALDLAHRDGALYLCRQATSDDPRADTGAWALAAPRGERGPGATSQQMEIAERLALAKLSDVGSDRERAVAAIEQADDFWAVSAEPTSATLSEFARAAVAGVVVAIAGEAARPAAEELGARVAVATLKAARDEERDGGLGRAQTAVRRAAEMAATPGRPERVLDGLKRMPGGGDRVMRAALQALLGR